LVHEPFGAAFQNFLHLSVHLDAVNICQKGYLYFLPSHLRTSSVLWIWCFEFGGPGYFSGILHNVAACYILGSKSSIAASTQGLKQVALGLRGNWVGIVSPFRVSSCGDWAWRSGLPGRSDDHPALATSNDRNVSPDLSLKLLLTVNTRSRAGSSIQVSSNVLGVVELINENFNAGIYLGLLVLVEEVVNALVKSLSTELTRISTPALTFATSSLPKNSPRWCLPSSRNVASSMTWTFTSSTFNPNSIRKAETATTHCSFYRS
jgi:hypothetical protein